MEGLGMMSRHQFEAAQGRISIPLGRPTGVPPIVQYGPAVAASFSDFTLRNRAPLWRIPTPPGYHRQHVPAVVVGPGIVHIGPGMAQEDLIELDRLHKRAKVYDELPAMMKLSAESTLGAMPGRTITVKEIQADRLTAIAMANWAATATKGEGTAAPPKKLSFNADLVRKIYRTELTGQGGRSVPLQRVMLLEISQYLEKYLWPNFDPETATYENVMSIILMVNEKFRENVPAWRCFHDREEAFRGFFRRVLTLKDGRSLTVRERVNYLLFVINSFQSLEDEMVRKQALRVVSWQLWHSLSPGRLQIELKSHPQLIDKWAKMLKKESRAASTSSGGGSRSRPPLKDRIEVKFIPSLISEFLEILSQVIIARPKKDHGDGDDRSLAAAVAAEDMEMDAQDGEAEGKSKGADKGESTHPAATATATAAGGRGEAELDHAALLYCERFVELMIDLLSQLPTRRFVRTVVGDVALVVKCRMSALYSHPKGRLFSQLVDLFRFYQGFEIDDHTGEQLSDDKIAEMHCSRLQALQRLAFKQWPQLRELALSNVGAIEEYKDLKMHLLKLSRDELHTLVTKQLHLVAPDDPWADRHDFLLEVILSSYQKRSSQREAINELPLYPNEDVLWDENLVPSINYTGEGALALPKLNLQFLTFHDYLLRNFNLFRLESTYEIREDIHDVAKRMCGVTSTEGCVTFRGWARMAVQIQGFKITQVKAPLIGEMKPAVVLAEVVFSIGSFKQDIRAEWNDLKEHDVLFLLTIRPPPLSPDCLSAVGKDVSVPEKYGIVYVRGCEVLEIRDEGLLLMNDFSGKTKREDWKPPAGDQRTLLVALDAAQYQMDMVAMAAHGAEDLYGTFNVLMRRKPKENNFKAILESIRDLMNEDTVVPKWLHDIFLGYGDPAAAQYHNMPDQLEEIDFKDTFLSASHLRECFPDHDVQFVTADGYAITDNSTAEVEPYPPFRVKFLLSDMETTSNKAVAAARGGLSGHCRLRADVAGGDDPIVMDGEGKKKKKEKKPVLLAEAYVPPDPGPYPQDKPKMNAVRFTPVQVEAIKSGVQPGLTMVVGPPGTGKTDVAVQILNVLYHNCPGQRTLLITHSNQALNDLFEKIMHRDVPARYLLRLGMGEQELDTEQVFSKQGRVNAMLARRLELLAEVERLARTLNVPEDAGYTCETAAHFWLLHVLSRWEKFVAVCEESQTPGVVKEHFPFKEYFADMIVGKAGTDAETASGLFSGLSYVQDMRAATGCFRHLKTMFQELEECRAFELLKTTNDRANYLMTKQAKIVAMTCTHAALKRSNFLQLGFKYDNLLMEESAQILEIETFIPMLLQRQEDGIARLKRCILIGDHHQLPPVVKNMAFQKYSHLDQSLFTRFVRLGTPYIQLNAQGRARPSLARLYSWRYQELGNLPNVFLGHEFQAANAGFGFEYQLIDVPDYEGVGEFEPNPWFYQNLGEAEYLVSVFQYMRLLGYPAHKISILSTYNGQKHLIRDVIERRCAHHPLFGRPSKVTTVDRFQGQQNDYILLSLVRTRVVGHLRDVRRLVVAMSRARLGLYVFCRRSLFEQCYELLPTFKQLVARPDKLVLVVDEKQFPTERQVTTQLPPQRLHFVCGLEEMAAIVASRYEDWLRTQEVEFVHRQRTAICEHQKQMQEYHQQQQLEQQLQQEQQQEQQPEPQQQQLKEQQTQQRQEEEEDGDKQQQQHRQEEEIQKGKNQEEDIQKQQQQQEQLEPQQQVQE